jgi:hypothetical protein
MNGKNLCRSDFWRIHDFIRPELAKQASHEAYRSTHLEDFPSEGCGKHRRQFQSDEHGERGQNRAIGKMTRVPDGAGLFLRRFLLTSS